MYPTLLNPNKAQATYLFRAIFKNGNFAFKEGLCVLTFGKSFFPACLIRVFRKPQI